MSQPARAEWLTVKDKRPVPYRDVVRQGVLVPIAPDGDRPQVRGVGMASRVEQLSELGAPWLVLRPHAAARPDDFLRVEMSTFSAERFVGVPVSTAVRALNDAGRCLPIAVWLRLADVMLDAMSVPPVPTRSGVAEPHPVWAMWPGPHALGATIDGRLLMSPGPLGLPFILSPIANLTTLADDWRSLPDMPRSEVERVSRVRRALRWCLSPWLFGFEGRRPGLGPLDHPELWDELRLLLTRSFEGTAVTVPWLREQLQALWSVVPPATEQEAARAVLASSPETLREEALACLESPEGVPASWRDGRLQVILDTTLEQLPDPRAFPLRKGSSVTAPVPVEPVTSPPPAPPARPQLSAEQMIARGRENRRRIAEEDEWEQNTDGSWQRKEGALQGCLKLLLLPFAPLSFVIRLLFEKVLGSGKS